MQHRRILRRSPEGEVSEHADVADLCGGYLNDMVVDRHGRAYAGEFGFDLDELRRPGDGGADPGRSGRHAPRSPPRTCYFPNGSVITPDGGTLIVGETAGARYTAFTIEQDGSLSDRRVWAQVAPTPPITTFEETLAEAPVRARRLRA